MRNSIVLCCLALVLVAPACKNQDTTLRDNIGQTWRISKVLLNGGDVTAAHNTAYESYKLAFERTNSYTETYYAFGSSLTTLNGTWEFYNDYMAIKLVETTTGTRYYDIVTLEDNSFILTETSGSNVTRYELVPD